MVVVLEIGHNGPGVYEARCEFDTGGPTFHGSISEVLAHYGQAIPTEFSRYVEVQYGGVNSGTTLVTRLQMEPDLMAQELVDLVRDVHNAV